MSSLGANILSYDDPNRTDKFLGILKELSDDEDSDVEDNLECENQDSEESDPESDEDYLLDVEEEDELLCESVRVIEAKPHQKRMKKSTAKPKKDNNSETNKNKVHHNLPQPRTNSETVTITNPVIEEDNVFGKNKFIWKTTPLSSKDGKTPTKNIIHVLPGPTAVARKASTPLECFDLFVSENILGKVHLHTNEEIARQRMNYKTNEGTLGDLTEEELKAFLGLLALSAAMKNNHLTSELLFNCSYSGSRYRATMSCRRFNFIINCLRFDEKDTRDERKRDTKLAPISEIWEMFLLNCRNHYKPGSYVTIDEQLVGFRGRCPFRMYIPSKPNKYGIKIMMMCDNSSKYMLDAQPYLGKESAPKNIPGAQFYVEKLVESIKGTNRNVTMDNWFSSIPLFLELLSGKKLTAVGTVKKNKKEFPHEFTDLNFQKRTAGSSLFLFHKNLTAVSYKPKPNKLVLLLSTMHDDASINQSSQKPEIVLTYNQTKGGVDTFDQLCKYTNCGRKTKRWPLCFFYNMINIAFINSYVIYVHNFYQNNDGGLKPMTRLNFLLELNKQLTENWQKQRLALPNISRELRGIIESVLPKDPNKAETKPTSVQKGPRKYCAYCNYKKRSMTTTYCAECSKPICGTHQKKSCIEC